ncbi:MAG: S9 family peptidase, partial [Verrucomicrobiales bacterium]
ARGKKEAVGDKKVNAGDKDAMGGMDGEKEEETKSPGEVEAEEKKAEEKKAEEKKSEDKKSPKAEEKKAEDKKSPKAEEKKGAVAKPLRETLDADSNVEVWHAKDVDIMPKQKKLAKGEDNPKRRGIWWPEEGKLIPLANELTERVVLLRHGKYAIGFDYTPHEEAAMFGPELKDVYLIDTTNGERKRILKGVEFLLNASPDGAWILYIRKGNIWSYQVESGEKRNLTGELGTAFTEQEDDSLAKEKKPYGEGKWLADSSGVLLYDRFNVWLVAADGSGARRLTDGDGEMIRHRISSANFTADDDGLLDPKRPLYLALYGERSKKTGYARMSLADGSEGAAPEVLIWKNRSVNWLRRAEKNDQVFVFKVESYRDSPDLFLAGPDLKKPEALTATNPFQKEFRWGRAELVDYRNESGEELQGALIYPANYKKGRTYPMVTYIYERLSQNLHRYVVPSETHPYNPSVFSAEGYFVFMPDIVYRPQEPGPSAVECIVPGVKAVLATGMVDPERVALIGHSWGAYQTAYAVTHSDVFAAGVAGAPLTDMMSMSMQIYWNSGRTNARIFGLSQGRMDKPFWRDVDNYIRNSPIHGMDNLDTPLLVAFGDKDGAVDFSQGVEMYNAARRAGKDDFVMLVYPGENHNLRREENQVDYHYRILEWLGHYLKDEKAPKWITEGKSYLERKDELEAKRKDGKEKKSAG